MGYWPVLLTCVQAQGAAWWRYPLHTHRWSAKSRNFLTNFLKKHTCVTWQISVQTCLGCERYYDCNNNQTWRERAAGCGSVLKEEFSSSKLPTGRLAYPLYDKYKYNYKTTNNAPNWQVGTKKTKKEVTQKNNQQSNSQFKGSHKSKQPPKENI